MGSRRMSKDSTDTGKASARTWPSASMIAFGARIAMLFSMWKLGVRRFHGVVQSAAESVTRGSEYWMRRPI